MIGIPDEVSVEVTHTTSFTFTANQSYVANSDDKAIATVTSESVKTLGQTCKTEITGVRPGSSTYVTFITADGKFKKRVKVNVTGTLIGTSHESCFWYDIDISSYRYTNPNTNQPKIMYVTKATNNSVGAEKIGLNWLLLKYYSTDVNNNIVNIDGYTNCIDRYVDMKDIPNKGNSFYYLDSTNADNYSADSVKGLKTKFYSMDWADASANNIKVNVTNQTKLDVQTSNYVLDGVFDYIYFEADVKVKDPNFNFNTGYSYSIKAHTICYGSNGEKLCDEVQSIIVDKADYSAKGQFFATKLRPDKTGNISRVDITLSK